MYVEEVALFGLTGMLTSIILWLITTEGKKIEYLLILTTVGITVGWLSGITWIYITGGLALSLYSLVIPTILSLLLSSVILFYLPKPRMCYTVSSRLFNLSLIIIILMSLFVAYLAIPISNPTAMNTEGYNQDISKNIVKSKMLTQSDVNNFYPSVSTMSALPIEIDGYSGSVSLLSSSEQPSEGDYLKFRITFSVSQYDWVKPYAKICIVKDNDGDAMVSEGDEIWLNTNYKVVTNSGDWRANLEYTNNQPSGEIFATDDGILPIFHASQITQWKDDTSYTFPNTPEGFTPPVDMISWDGSTLKENVVSYSTIQKGTTSYIEGKIYCPTDSNGNYLIVVEAYDARYTNPYENNNPLATKIIPFQIQQGKPSITIDWTIAIILTAVSIPSTIGAVYYLRR